ncbi:23S rRNA (uridine(2552)-2'-O)-methyltransferase RlmE [Methylonatrum kenyense]|uniref:23S rRNA (uridine(2552)-2'-O)-methyltransferase RlmE n=1 Tax=Methylonatrum kenyense TaxID=455253 RepID=UPI0020C165C8|nr:23S rRNA (uridine(2552)-2'-O)-methyltransferase RlmE [Methylonatrum kenyense]MCK8515901.1 23S rRNA (uridine(2552)-2'-O)-methyltransferase RlmE [Methylonatrum kenyense]
MMARSKSSGRWLREHFNDPFVKQAQRQGYRSRAVFKLQEIDAKDRLLRPGMVVVDLGAAPGGWSQFAAEKVGSAGRVVALDILPMDALADTTVLQADFTEDEALQQLRDALGGRPVDLVLSDMAPNISGMKAVDQPRAMYLVELALDFARDVLKPGGDFLVKTFQGEGFDPFLKTLRSEFDRVVSRKPEASRGRSREIYLLARGRRL